MILFLGELLFSLVEIFIRLCQSFPKVPNSENAALAWYLLLLVVEDGQRLMDQSLFLLACIVVTLLRTSFLKFIPIFLTLRGNLTSGFLNVQLSPARMMMLTISTLIYWACSLESKKLCKVLTLW